MVTDDTTQLAPRYLLNYIFAKKNGVLVHSVADDTVQIACRTSVVPEAINEVQRLLLGKHIQIQLYSDEEFNKLLTTTYEVETDTQELASDITGELDLERMARDLPQTEDLLETEDDAPIIRLINAVLAQAIKQHASDVHIETFEKKLIVRFRIDGILRVILEPERLLAPLVISRIKVMAKLDIAEKRVPQDGRISVRVAGREIDVRVSTMPTSYGERVVLRILDRHTQKLDLAQLGMSDDALVRITQLVQKPHGILLVTGPTGSGKTTTLYAALTLLNKTSRNILTVEDPVEYNLPGIGQTQVNPKVGMTFASGLRAILRQDPDIVMVGEIRDRETAEVSIQASLTGHLVLSTLHTNSAISALTRLHDMGVEPFLLTSTIIGVIAQRLVRSLCSHCKAAVTATVEQCATLGVDAADPPTIYQATGCAECVSTGYKGRLGVYELLIIDEKLRELIHDNASEGQIEAYVRPTMPSLRQDGYRLILLGKTTLEEVIRVADMDI